MARIAVVVGHPRTGTLCEALAERYAAGAREGGHDVQTFVLGRMAFDPVLRRGYDGLQPLEPDLAAAREAILAADHLVFMFPLWLGTLPAMFKGFLERVLQPDLLASKAQGRFVQSLAGKSVRVIMTMAMPGIVYRWWYGAYALNMLKRNILGFLGAGPIRSTVHGNVEGVGTEGRARWLTEAANLGRTAG
jgi:putative NADPH-quinone reductase